MTADLAAALALATVAMAVPLIYAALGELIAEKAGVVNIGLEGLVLIGAFTAFAVAHGTGSITAAVAATVCAGAVIGLGFAFLVVSRNANQIVVGTALNLFAAGVTATAYRALFGVTGTVAVVEGTTAFAVPLLSEIPLIGPALFHQTPLAYACFVLVPACAFVLRRTRVGLQLRMVGENPRAAAMQGIAVHKIRTLALAACGAIAAAGGAFLALDYTHTFVEGMSSGRGFIALAIVILGRRHATGVLAASLLFGLATALQFHFQALAFDIPFQFFLVLPYVATLLLLALSAGDTNAPAGLGKEQR
jgi:simple sugar transport system permease protein